MHSLVSFVINSFLLGVGLAMDAFSVSMANGLNAPKMSRSMRIMIPLTFAVFQFLMPVIGWFCVRSVAEAFVSFQRAIPWIALVLLLFIGGKMLLEGIRGGDTEHTDADLKPGALLMQGVATSIDALSVGPCCWSHYRRSNFCYLFLRAPHRSALRYPPCRESIHSGRRDSDRYRY